MYATILPTDAAPPAAATEEFTLRQIAGPRDVVLRLHDGDPTGTDRWIVETDSPLGPPGAKTAVAAVVTFSGPMPPAVREAADRADHDRIGPAMAARATSTGRVLRLWQEDQQRKVVVVFAVDQPTLHDGFRTIEALELLPGEDPALLPGPDHVEIFEVTAVTS
ncbi:hypothetical protein PSU4_02880 [Pseudonocardia sulfidoxydans NBRC 16205]|uniref:Uncharacterized protein n=1 Tax=Pseudonocardia sulfidoxydans NBRC 16205 TaxID=1223511 RepID=A0A511DCF0_9PSEU|nr:hypothetical protein [Pseudonocardia sulfidoxydans]GEL21334.1 hypothetical protein PSU4_02880 [Pseudonocardia sulfidoxydans NBRC 16205]